MDSWTKIQSGSIYYALGKLEKEGCITLQNEEKIDGKIRKIYAITEKGREVLWDYIKEELDREIYDIGSDKFIIYPILQGIDKKIIIAQVKKHIEKLKMQKKIQEKWKALKIKKGGLKLEEVCFEMMISSLDYQIKWHETLLEELDQCIALSGQMAQLIREVDFSAINDISEVEQEVQVDAITQLKEEILNQPENAKEKLDQLIKLLKNE